MMEEQIKFATSPFLFFQPDFKSIKIIEGVNQTRVTRFSTTIYEVLWFFLAPATIKDALAKGVDNQALIACMSEGLILDIKSQKYISASMWEDNNWSRAAYLMLSQSNLIYEEKIEGHNSIQLIDQRRSLMSKYSREKPYPKRFIPEGNIINLTEDKTDNKIDYESIKSRKSVRGFSNKAVKFSEFSEVLIKSTLNTREAEITKSDGDPYFFLNSFYTWLTIYVAVQSVEGVDRGIYFFDQENKRLVQVKKDVTDEEIHNCIQKQIWIKGGGFCLFIGAQWERYAWIYRHSRAYINLLIQLGEISEEFLINSYAINLGGWMTPAVTESKANQLCQLKDSSIDILYFMKFGYPPEVKETSKLNIHHDVSTNY